MTPSAKQRGVYGSHGPRKGSTRQVSRKERQARKRRAEEKGERARQQVLAAYKPGWTMLRPEERKSRTGIARGLFRRGLVTAVGSPDAVRKVLESLEGRIKLPPRTGRGGNRKGKR